MMRTPNTYPVAAARGFHYCKVLSPFRVIEWIYVDSLFSKDGIKNDYLDDEDLEDAIDDFYNFAEDGIEFV